MIVGAMKSSIWDDPVWTNIIELSGEPIGQNLDVKRIKPRLDVIVIQMSGCVEDILGVATTKKTKNCRKYQPDGVIER